MPGVRSQHARLVRQSGPVHIRLWPRGVSTLGFTAGVLVMMTGCTTGPAGSGASSLPKLGMSLVQQRTDEGTSRVHLRVTNDDPSDVPVTGIGLEWPNYPSEGVNAYKTVLPSGQVLDLPFELPTPVCTSPVVAPVGLVATSGAVVRAPLDETGRDFLYRVWERECTRKSVTDRVSLAFQHEWRTVPHRDSLALAGTLNLTRVRGSDRVAVLGFEGSVLLDVFPGGRLARLSPSGAVARLPVLLTSTGRCDPHSRAESKQTFLFRVEVKVGNDLPVRVIVVPGHGMQVKALDLLDNVCG